MAVTHIETTDVMVLQRPASYDANDTDAGTFHFSLGDLSEFIEQTGITCHHGIAEPNLYVLGDLWFDSKDNIQQLFVATGTPDALTWEPVANSLLLQTEFNAKVVADRARFAVIDAQQTVQNKRLDDAESEILSHTDELGKHDNRITALEGATIRNIYEIPSTIGADPATGEIYILKADGSSIDADYADGVKFKINVTDKNSETPAIVTFTQNDIIRVNGVNTIGATYKITNIVASQTIPVYEYDVQCIGNFSAPIFDTELEIDFLKSFDPSQYATIQYSDDQDDLKVSKTGDTMTGNLTMKGESTRIYTKNDSDQTAFTLFGSGKISTLNLIEFDRETGMNYIIFKGDGANLAQMYPTSSSNIFKLRAYKGKSISISSYNGETERTSIKLQNGSVTIERLNEPTADHHPITRKYFNNNKFQPGNQVANDSATGVEIGGFYLSGTRLYVRVS